MAENRINRIKSFISYDERDTAFVEMYERSVQINIAAGKASLASWQPYSERERRTRMALPMSKTKMYIDEAIRWVLLEKGLPLGPANDLLRNIKSDRAQIIGLCLGRIIQLRKGESCGDKELAYADHYFQARAMTAFLGPLSLVPTATIVVGYETKKWVWEKLGILEDMASDDQCKSPVSPDGLSVKWGLSGALDGAGDYYVQHPEQARMHGR